MLKRLQLIPRIQWVAWRTVPVTGAGAGHGGRYTIPVATRWHVLPIPVHVGERQALKHTDSGAKQGQKGSVMHRFRGCRGKLDAKKYQVPPRFPRLRGCTRPIVNSWVKFFPWGTGEGVPFWACQAKSTCGHSTGGIYFWSVSASSGLHPIPSMSSKIDARPFHVRRGKHAAIPRGTYRPRRRAYPSGGQLQRTSGCGAF